MQKSDAYFRAHADPRCLLLFTKRTFGSRSEMSANDRYR